MYSFNEWKAELEYLHIDLKNNYFFTHFKNNVINNYSNIILFVISKTNISIRFKDFLQIYQQKYRKYETMKNGHKSLFKSLKMSKCSN